MSPSRYAQKVEEALRHPLPGWEAHKQMVPPGKRDLVRDNLIRPNHRKGGVLILLYPDQTGTLYLALIRRPEYDGVHSGQIALPGGALEAGETPQEAALREAQEEVGASPAEITMLGQLSTLYIPPSNFLVYPFVGFQPCKPAFSLDSWEVAELIEAPLALFFDQATRHTTVLENSGKELIKTPCFNIFGHQVWGATAMILNELVAVIQTQIYV